ACFGAALGGRVGRRRARGLGPRRAGPPTRAWFRPSAFSGRTMTSKKRRSKPIVAIDGPAGSGKTTVSRRVAQQLGYVVLDTGALYRTIALATSRAGLEPDAAELGPFCEALVARSAIMLESLPGGEVRVLLDGEDVSSAIRTPEMSQRASEVSVVPGVRAALLELQRRVGED